MTPEKKIVTIKTLLPLFNIERDKMYTIAINNLVLTGTHGVTEKEKTTPQRFQINIVLQASRPQAAMTDRIEDTVDYRQVKKIAEAIIAGPHCKLLETLVDRIAEQILAVTPADCITVTIKKLEIWENGAPSVSITKERRTYHD